MNRRTFFHGSFAAALVASLPAQTRRAPRILLCSGWQTVNIGDIAHTPAPSPPSRSTSPAPRSRSGFSTPSPRGARDDASAFPAPPARRGQARRPPRSQRGRSPRGHGSRRFFLHGSGPATLAWAHAEAFARRTGRGFGIHGVTYGLYGIPERATLSRARFVYFRDSASLARARADGVRAPVMAWGPDTAFATDLRDDTRADAFLRAHDLADGKFLCCISRYRFTPFWLMPSKNEPLNPARHARNEEKKLADHAPLLAAITAVVRETDLRVLLCPRTRRR